MKISKFVLPKSKLRPECNRKHFKFNTTDDVSEHKEFLGQTRALEAISFAVDININAYHVFAAGPGGIGKKRLIMKYLKNNKKNNRACYDWCYVYNFKLPYQPIALRFSAGDGAIFKNDIKLFIDELIYALPEMFESKEYKAATEKINYKYKTKIEIKNEKLIARARKSDLLLVLKDEDYNIVPLFNDQQMTKEQYHSLSDNDRRTLKNKIKKLKLQLGKLKDFLPEIYKEKHNKLTEVKNEFVRAVIKSLMMELRNKYNAPKVMQYFDELENDIVSHPEEFQKDFDLLEIDEINALKEKPGLLRYHVNLVINNQESKLPIIYEANPNYNNLIGQLEGIAQHGMLISDLTLIKPGAIHKANGGYLIIEISKLLKDLQAWNCLKRILLSKKIFIESEGIKNSTQLQPEPIPLEIKIILLGSRYEYDTLSFDDDDFMKLFKVLVDFETSIERTDDNVNDFISYISFIINKRKLKPFHSSAVRELVNYCIRLSGFSHKISIVQNDIFELLDEANYWATKFNHAIVGKEDIFTALQAKEYRIDKIREEYYEELMMGHFLVELTGKAVGQINAISVISLSNFSFGRPTKITATTRSGNGSMIDIQREVKLGGSNHSKGVLILNGYLKGRYARNFPFYLSASLVLEQTYTKIDGDSASLSELCALISSLANIPICQSIGVTGSVNQLGFVQPVGDINEKIEGFYNFCHLKGLTGNQGVIIPKANVMNLMLNQKVTDACSKGDFSVYAIQHLDEALSILMKKEPSEVHTLCELTLIKFAKTRIELMKMDSISDV